MNRRVFIRGNRGAPAGVHIVGHVNAVMASNTTPGSISHVSTKQDAAIVQQGGQTTVEVSFSPNEGSKRG